MTYSPLQIPTIPSNIGEILLVILAVVTIVCLVAVVVYKLAKYIYHKYFFHKSDEFLDVLEEYDTVTILLHSDPDPDTMASALGVQRITRELDIESKVKYPGRISHHKNRAFRAVLDLDFERLTTDADLSDENVIVVDHQDPRGFDSSDSTDPIAVIDHHDETYTGNADFVHVEPSVGACSTILVEYLRQMGLSFNVDDMNPDISEVLATAMYFAIQTDTSNFSQGVSYRDYDAAQNLYPLLDTDKLFEMSNPKIEAETFEVKSKAFHTRKVEGSFAVSNVQEVQNSDSIPQASEELSRLEGLSAVIVFGQVEDTLRLSGRNYDSRVHMGSVMERALEDIPDASGGGHSQMGGGQIPMSALEEEGLTISELEEILLDAMQGRL